MKTLRRAMTFLVAGAMALVSAAAAQSPRDLPEQMIPPDLVLAQAEAIGLSAAQRQAVRRVQAELQPRMPPLLRQMRQERDALVALLALEKPDEAAVLAQFEKLNAVETELKRLRIQMTVGVKKVLTAEQQAKALALQGKRLSDSTAAAGPDTLPAKLQRVKEGLEQWKREGRDVTPLRELWERFRAAEDKGYYRQARQALDEAIALLDAPPARQ
jgi:Spy/CpxP family protein refolding chaperone